MKTILLFALTLSPLVAFADPALPGALVQTDLKQRLTPAYWRTRQAERHALAANRVQLRAARKPFGDLPVIALAKISR